MATNFTYSQARANLAKILDDVSNNKEVVMITRRNAENIALIPESELSALLETAHLLRSPKNAQRLLTTLLKVQDETGKAQTVHELKVEYGIEEKKSIRNNFPA